MRQYEPVWLQLKEHKIAKVAVPKFRHRRIIQAVRKEKWRDDAFKLVCAEEGYEYILRDSINTDNDVITFTLEKNYFISLNNL